MADDFKIKIGIQEMWSPIPNYKNYEVSNFGRVKNINTNLILKPTLRAKPPRDYYCVNLSENGERKIFSVHILVMLCFVGLRSNDKIVINHIDGNKHNNNLSNLEYCTQSHNKKQDFIMGRQSFRGVKNNCAKLNPNKVLEIKELRAKGYKYRELADNFGVSISCISNIMNRYDWEYL